MSLDVTHNDDSWETQPSQRVEFVARAMYWDFVVSDRTCVTVRGLMRDWDALPEARGRGVYAWHCKDFWWRAAQAAIAAMAMA